MESMLPGIDAHPHAQAVLEPALRPGGRPAHAYLLHGPPGSGKADVARAFAAALLADETRPSSAIAERIARSSHPDFKIGRASCRERTQIQVADVSITKKQIKQTK